MIVAITTHVAMWEIPTLACYHHLLNANVGIFPSLMFLVLLLLIAGTLLHFNLTIFNCTSLFVCLFVCYVNTCVAMTALVVALLPALCTGVVN